MRYEIKKLRLSWGHDFTIRDKSGREVFFVKGRVLSIGDRLSLKDMSGNEVALIVQQGLSWGLNYHIYRDGEHIATLKKKLGWLYGSLFYVEVPGSDNLETDGDFWNYEYRFTRNGRWVATAQFPRPDCYRIEIKHKEDDVLILVSVVVIAFNIRRKRSLASYR